MTNATIGLVMAAKALGLRGGVVVPSFTFIASAQALTWAGLEPVFCDVDPSTHQVTVETVGRALEAHRGSGVPITGILGVNSGEVLARWVALEALADEHGLLLLFDSAQGVGSAVGGRPLGGFGELEVFSFHATKILKQTEGGCVCTDDDDLAVRLRSLRSDDGGNTPVPGTALAAASFSEAQAAIGLISPSTTSRPTGTATPGYSAATQKALAHVPGINVVDPAGVTAATTDRRTRGRRLGVRDDPRRSAGRPSCGECYRTTVLLSWRSPIDAL